MAELESQPESHPPTAKAVPASVTGGRPVRALGRGLEDLSHLFLPRRPGNEPDAEPQAAPKADKGRVAASDHAGTMLLRPVARLTRSQVVAAIQEPWGALEEHLRAIDAAVSCSPCGAIDVLGLDEANRLVVVDVDPFTADGLLLRGLSHVEWIVRNIDNVRRMYQAQTVDYAAAPRLVLVAPRFSAAIRSAVRQIPEPEITCVRYQGLDVSGWTGIFFEPVTDEGR
jgi:hypothetical protein